MKLSHLLIAIILTCIIGLALGRLLHYSLEFIISDELGLAIIKAIFEVISSL